MSDNAIRVIYALVGAILMLCINIVFDDFKMAAHAGEPAACRDEPDRKAYMLRLPGESHSVEHCEHVARYGDPRWIPDFQSPLMPRREGNDLRSGVF